MALSSRAIRGRLLTFLRAPRGAGDAQSYRYLDDGIILVKDGRIEAVGPADELTARLPAGTLVEDHADALILPGFIDPHIHYPQTQVIASYGAQLLEWLEKYTFVEEQKFADPMHAARNAEFFLDELARNGTTTAVAYCTAHPASAEALFAAAHIRNAGMIAGNSVMNRNGPPGLLAPASTAMADSRDLIRRWHGTGRQRYAVTPRFAITSTDEQLAELGALLQEFPTVLMQTHLDENLNEIATIKRLFPNDPSYTAVYARFGLLSPRSLMGHCIHLEDGEVALLRDTQSVAVFCPTSNLFIGSGLFDYERLNAAGVRIALATDVGGGTSYSMLRTAAEAYKVMQLAGPEPAGARGIRSDDAQQRRRARPRKRDRRHRARRVCRPRRTRCTRHARNGPSHGSGAQPRRGIVRADDARRRPRGASNLHRRQADALEPNH